MSRKEFYQGPFEPSPQRRSVGRMAKDLTLGALLVGAATGVAVLGVNDFSSKRSRSEALTAQAQALAQSYAAKISSIAVQDSVESGRPVNVSYSDGQTRLVVDEPHSRLSVAYTTSGESTAPKDVQSIAMSYFPKPHLSLYHMQDYFLMYNGVNSGMPGWTMGQTGSVTGPAVPEATYEQGFTEYNTGYKTVPSDWSKLGIERMTVPEFAALEDGANLALQHIQADANH